jgi:hypothetical protein
MGEGMEAAARAVVIGVGATAVLDLWAAFAQRALGLPAANMALLGRWVGHFPRGRFAHDSIAQAEPASGERLIGWLAHYAIGVAFGAALVAIAGLDWARRPTLPPALIFGVVTVAAPLLVMQPAMGLGVAASRTPNPTAARLRSLMSHTVFGVGLYLAALAAALVWR